MVRIDEMYNITLYQNMNINSVYCINVVKHIEYIGGFDNFH